MKYKVTNTSQLSEGGKRNVFVTEAGKLIKPGEHCVCNRLDNGTRKQADAKVLKIEEGEFPAPPLFPKEPVKPPEPPTASTKEGNDRAAADARAMDDRMSSAAADEKSRAETSDESDDSGAEDDKEPAGDGDGDGDGEEKTAAPDLSKMNVDELRGRAAELDIDLPSRLRRDEIITAIEGAEASKG